MFDPSSRFYNIETSTMTVTYRRRRFPRGALLEAAIHPFA